MSKVSDYIASLEGKENIDPLVVASTLLELHNEEMGIASNKIASLEETITENTNLIAERDKELQTQKAKNWDLVNRIPADTNDQVNNSENDPDVRDATFDDFFKKED